MCITVTFPMNTEGALSRAWHRAWYTASTQLVFTKYCLLFFYFKILDVTTFIKASEFRRQGYYQNKSLGSTEGKILASRQVGTEDC